MLHEFMIKIALSEIDEAIEKLNLNNYYNLYYDQPIEQFQEENGYGFIEIQNSFTMLKVILENSHDLDVQKSKFKIASILNVDEKDVHYQSLEVKNWQQPFPVIDLKNGWFIQPIYSDENIDEGKVFHFEPPRAFGSGLHQTTQDCLRMILSKDLQGKRVLDLGTGAGLLSIATALARAEEVVAVDIEDVEAEVMYNARLNKVENKITVIQENVLHLDFKVADSFDLILMNIAANEIKELLPFVDASLVHNGILILSGMAEWNYEEALALYKEKGYSILDISQSDEWVTALVTKGSGELT